MKKRSKELDITINELFVGAIVSAYSKLDLPKDRTPEQLLGMLAVSTANRESISDDF